MLKKERHAYILHEVNVHNKVLSSILSQQISVSLDTIRRDLTELSEEGKIIKVHGGALSHAFGNAYPSFTDIYSHREKKKIGEKAVTLIREGMFVFTTGGTTIIELARCLPPDLMATFISGSLPAVMEYSNHPTIEVILIGDKVSKNSRITIGGEAISKIKEIRADLCFLGINAIDVNHGISDNDWDVVQVKKAMIESSKKVICLTIAEKMNTVQPIKVCDLKDIDILITELQPDDPVLKPYAETGIQII